MKHCLFLLLALLGGTTTVSAENWSHWRGPQQNGVSRDRDLPDTFSLKTKDNLLWRVPYGGITTPIVQNGRVYVINRVGEGATQQERVMCFDAATASCCGNTSSTSSTPTSSRDRLGWTQMVGDPETGNVYAHGTQGFLTGFDKDGKVLWEHSLTEEYGRITGYGGRTTSPIVDGDLLIIGMINASLGRTGPRRQLLRRLRQTHGRGGLVGFHRVSRQEHLLFAFRSSRSSAANGCSSPAAATAASTPSRFAPARKCGATSSPRGRSTARRSSRAIASTSATAKSNSDSDEQGRVVCLDAGRSRTANRSWSGKWTASRSSSPRRSCTTAGSTCPTKSAKCSAWTPRRGKELWNYQYGKNTKGSPVWADGKIYITEVDSNFHILKPKDEGCNELSAAFFKSPGVAPVELNGSPAIVNGRIYFMTTNELFCIGKKDRKARRDKAAQKPAENVRRPAPSRRICKWYPPT